MSGPFGMQITPPWIDYESSDFSREVDATDMPSTQKTKNAEPCATCKIQDIESIPIAALAIPLNKASGEAAKNAQNKTIREFLQLHRRFASLASKFATQAKRKNRNGPNMTKPRKYPEDAAMNEIPESPNRCVFANSGSLEMKCTKHPARR